MSNEDKGKFYYTHSNKAEMIAFVAGYLSAACSQHKDPNVSKLLKGKTVATTEKEAANEALYAVIVGHIRNFQLVTTLGTRFDGKGKEALDYIKSAFDDGDEDENLSVAMNTYLKLQTNKLTGDVAEFIDVCNQMYMARTMLTGSHREIDAQHHAPNLSDMVKNIGGNIEIDVRRRLDQMSSANKKDVDKVTKMLEGVLRGREQSEDSNAKALRLAAERADKQDREIAELKRTLASKKATSRKRKGAKRARTSSEEASCVQSTRGL